MYREMIMFYLFTVLASCLFFSFSRFRFLPLQPTPRFESPVVIRLTAILTLTLRKSRSDNTNTNTNT